MLIDEHLRMRVEHLRADVFVGRLHTICFIAVPDIRLGPALSIERTALTERSVRRCHAPGAEI